MSKGQRASGASQLRHYLKRQGITQAALAAELGLSDAHLSEILSGRAWPSLLVAVRLQNVTGIPAASFAKAAA